MDPLTLPEIAAMSGAKLLGKDTGVSISNINKDTRSIQPGDLYVGLRGEKFDCNEFAADAISR